MEYFDFHLHTLFKHVLTNGDPSKRRNALVPLKMAPKLPELSFILDSQSSPSQIFRKNTIYCCTLLALERGYAKQDLVQKIAPLLTPLDRNFIGLVANNRISYLKLLHDEWDYTHKNITSSFQDIAQFLIPGNGKLVEGKSGVIITIEGGHCFLSDIKDAVSNFKDFKESLKQDGSHLFSMNLTHLNRIDEGVQKELCTFAYGVKLVKDKVFYPRGSGISKEGREIIKAAYEHSNDEHPTLIDIKHMSLISRKEFYELRKTDLEELAKFNKNGFDTIPIISSHSGLTGMSWNDFPNNVIETSKIEDGSEDIQLVRTKRIKALENPVKTWFNPWTINFFDEDIEEIVASKGLIGISLDQRILGFETDVSKFLNRSRVYQGEEYMSMEEYKQLKIDEEEVIENLEAALVDTETVTPLEAFEVLGIGEQEFNKRKHTCYFIGNVLHVWFVAFKWYMKEGASEITEEEASDRAWSHICIGSDFDGLIDPVNSFTNATELDVFRKWLFKMFDKCAGNFLKERKLGTLPIGGTKGTNEQLEGLIYGNGKAFVERWLG